MSVCHVCLGDTDTDTDEAYHARCVRKVFRSATPPTLDVTLAGLHLAALEMVGHTTLAGVQKKLSVDLDAARATLRVAAAGGHYILKPQTETYPALPENEHVTTRLAELVGISTSPNGLVALADGSRAFIVRRFDRLARDGKVRQEDFCQLAEKSPREKYAGSAELCVRLVRRYASEPMVEMLKLYRLLVFTWWTGNGDMHLKNFSVFVTPGELVQLTPAYDLLCTRLVIPNDQLALTVLGKKDGLNRRSWLSFAEYCGIPEKAATRVLDAHASAHDRAVVFVERSFVPDDQKARYRVLLAERTAALS